MNIINQQLTLPKIDSPKKGAPPKKYSSVEERTKHNNNLRKQRLIAERGHATPLKRGPKPMPKPIGRERRLEKRRQNYHRNRAVDKQAMVVAASNIHSVHEASEETRRQVTTKALDTCDKAIESCKELGLAALKTANGASFESKQSESKSMEKYENMAPDFMETIGEKSNNDNVSSIYNEDHTNRENLQVDPEDVQVESHEIYDKRSDFGNVKQDDSITLVPAYPIDSDRSIPMALSSNTKKAEHVLEKKKIQHKAGKPPPPRYPSENHVQAKLAKFLDEDGVPIFGNNAICIKNGGTRYATYNEKDLIPPFTISTELSGALEEIETEACQQTKEFHDSLKKRNFYHEGHGGIGKESPSDFNLYQFLLTRSWPEGTPKYTSVVNMMLNNGVCPGTLLDDLLLQKFPSQWPELAKSWYSEEVKNGDEKDE